MNCKIPFSASRSFALIAALALGFSLCGLTVTKAGDSAPSTVEHQLPPKNLARLNLGARIEASTSKGVVLDQAPEQAAVLLSDDQTMSCALAEGRTTFVVSLAKAATLERFSFINENATAHGEITIAVSNFRLAADSKKWTPVDGRVVFTGKRLLDFSMLGIEAKYVRLAFQVEKAGRIAGFGLFGEDTMGADVQTAANSSRTHELGNESFNFAKLYARSHVVWVSSGELQSADRMIDGDPLTSFSFDARDPQPTAIIRLGAAERLQRVSALVGSEPTEVEVFLLDEMPENPARLTGLKPVLLLQDTGATGKVAGNFEAIHARYVVLRWKRNPATTRLDSQGNPQEFRVLEVNAFGHPPTPEFFSASMYAGADLYTSSESGGSLVTQNSSPVTDLAENFAPPVLEQVTP